VKICIVTFHKAINYGAVLQAWALQKYLSKYGNVTFLDYDYAFECLPLQKVKRPLWYLMRLIQMRLFAFYFHRFRGKHIKQGTAAVGRNGLATALQSTDVFVCGSDQIWNPDHTRDVVDEKTSWLAFVDGRSVRKVSYAASFGCDTLPPDNLKRVARYALDFYKHSVREPSGVEILQTMGCTDVACVPDPTLLLTAKDYEVLITPSAKKYDVFAFSLGSGALQNVAASYASTEKKTIKSFSHLSLKSYLLDLRISPSDWLEDIRNSSLVITDSYHATCFSVIFRRDFVVVLKGGGQRSRNGRIQCLLEQLGLTERAINECDLTPAAITEKLCAPVNWGEVEEQIAAFQKKGYEYIDSMLDGAHAFP